MALSIGKRDVRAIADVLDQDYDSAEDAAKAVIEACFDLYESKAKFTVVGQLYYSIDGGWHGHDDAEASKVALGAYGTEKQAENAAKSFVISSATGEQFRAWVLPVYPGTPASYFSKRKDAKKKVKEDEAVIDARERFRNGDGRTMADALKALREENGWVTDEEMEEQAAAAATCPECGHLLDTEHDGLATGHEVKP